jgi:hypothetical protein
MRTVMTVSFGSAKAHQSDGHPASAADQLICRRWSIVMAMRGRLVGNPHDAATRARFAA